MSQDKQSGEPPDYEAAVNRAKVMRDEDHAMRERIAQGHRNRDARVLAKAQAGGKPLPAKPRHYDLQTPAWRRAWDLAARRG